MNIFGFYIADYGLLLILFFIFCVFIFIINLLIARAARKWGRSFTGFFILSWLFTPIIGGLILLLLGKNEEEIIRLNLESGVS